MKRLLSAPLAALLTAACGACGSDGSSQVPLGIAIQGLTPSDIGQIQLVVLSHGVRYNCGTLRSTCLRSQVLNPDGTPKIPDLVKLKDGSGPEKNALRFPADGNALSSSGQTFEAHMPAGQGYLFVVEVLSKGTPAMVLASGCSNVVDQISSGDNRAVQVQAQTLQSPLDCAVEID